MQARKWIPLQLLGAALAQAAQQLLRITLAAAEISPTDKPETNTRKGVVACG